ncbi:MAG: hypothetical protein L6416_07920 [Candidatus Omnitrophica bacterium]|nr:hypothetical protein [Candidatus Omnitrophota bacterium]
MKSKKNKFFKIITFLLIQGYFFINLAIILPDAYAGSLNRKERSTLSAKINMLSLELKNAFNPVLNRSVSQSRLLSPAAADAPKENNNFKKNRPEKKHAVLFICNGNQERSQMAAQLMNNNIPPDLAEYFIAESAGLLKPDNSITELLSRHPLLRNRTPKKVTETMLRDAKIIFVMTGEQKERLERKYPDLTGKIFLLMGDKKLDAVKADYDINGPTYTALEKTITARLPEIYNQLRGILAQEHVQGLPGKIKAVTFNDNLIHAAI